MSLLQVPSWPARAAGGERTASSARPTPSPARWEPATANCAASAKVSGLRAAVRLVVTARGALLDGGWAQPEVPRAAPTATRPAARRRDPHLCSALRSPACSAVPDERLAVRGGRRPAGEHPRQGQKSSEGWSSALRGQTESWAVQPEKRRLRGELRAARLRLKGL